VLREEGLADEALAKQAQGPGYPKVSEAEQGQYEFKNRRRMLGFFRL
jgi:hypothetical protein